MVGCCLRTDSAGARHWRQGMWITGPGEPREAGRHRLSCLTTKWTMNGPRPKGTRPGTQQGRVAPCDVNTCSSRYPSRSLIAVRERTDDARAPPARAMLAEKTFRRPHNMPATAGEGRAKRRHHARARGERSGLGCGKKAGGKEAGVRHSCQHSHYNCRYLSPEDSRKAEKVGPNGPSQPSARCRAPNDFNQAGRGRSTGYESRSTDADGHAELCIGMCWRGPARNLVAATKDTGLGAAGGR